MTRRPALTALALVAALAGTLLGAAPTGGTATAAPLLAAPAAPPARAAGSAGSTGSTGSTGGGDPYFPLDGNGGYDVRHYRIEITYDPDTDRLEGVTVVRARATRRLTSLHLDLVLAADAVRVDGRPATSSAPDPHELRVVPARPVAAGRAFRVRVRYHGSPASVRLDGIRPNSDVFFHTRGETVAIGEPQNAPWWFPANETPADKATYDISLRVPRGFQAVSNGELESRRSDHGWRTWHWEMTEPMVTYLAFFAAGRFALERGTTSSGLPYTYAVSERVSDHLAQRWRALLHQTPDVVDWLAGRFGDYPFASTGGVVTALPVGYALETQSRPVYPSQGFSLDPALIVHEQAHQWFGNDVALTRWADIWLNEGFATYAEWLYAEDNGGRTTAQELATEYAAADPAFWELSLTDPGPGRIFGEEVYTRGAMTLAALRTVVDDHAPGTLEEILRTWVVEHGGGGGTTEDFIGLAERVSGRDLAAFFQHWLRDREQPQPTAGNGLV